MTAREGRGLLSRLFGRKPAPPPPVIDRRDNSEDWRVGDLAVCLVDGEWEPVDTGPRIGDVRRVSGIEERVGHVSKALLVCLTFGEFPGFAYSSASFRKIRPDAEPCEEEFTALIKRGRKMPKRVGV